MRTALVPFKGISVVTSAKAKDYDGSDIHLLGDARKVANSMYAIWDAFELASYLD